MCVMNTRSQPQSGKAADGQGIKGGALAMAWAGTKSRRPEKPRRER